MKFMKLGSKPDTFYTTDAARTVSCEVSSDLIIQVKGSKYLLHKFPLLSKCLTLQRLCLESHDSIKLPDFPGGAEAFELCAKFCYGITITLSAFNIVPIRCAAEYLQMTEEVDKGNLVYKVKVFLNSCILHGWRDSIETLQTTKAFPLLSEELGLTSRCIEAVVSKVLARPDKTGLSGSSNGLERCNFRAKGWWGEDLVHLEIGLFWRVIVAIKSCKKVASNLIGDALKVYVSNWLPNLAKSNQRGVEGVDDCNERDDSKDRMVLESIVSLLPIERNAVSCSFLLKLLKASNILKASLSTKEELARRVGLQLEEAAVADLLLPQTSSVQSDTVYDVDTVMAILQGFVSTGPMSPPSGENRVEVRRRSMSAEEAELELQERRRSSSSSHSSKLKVAKLVDGYLQEIAKDKNLPMGKFIALAEILPQFARPSHDDLYKAIDIYLKGHQELNKREKKRLCKILDCKKLSMEACMHAAQNELLPLRVVVQVLFFEQAREGSAVPNDIKAKPKASVTTLQMKLDEDDDHLGKNLPNGVVKSLKMKSLSMMPSTPKMLFSKLWPISRSASEKN